MAICCFFYTSSNLKTFVKHINIQTVQKSTLTIKTLTMDMNKAGGCWRDWVDGGKGEKIGTTVTA